MGSESSNSMKFPPLRLAELLPNLMALKTKEESPDTTYSSGEDSDCSPPASPRTTADHPPPLASSCLLVSNRTPLSRAPAPGCANSQKKSLDNKENNPFVSEPQNIVSEHSKDFALKCGEENESASRTYPGRGCGDVSCPSLPHQPNSEVKKRNILSIRNNSVLRTLQSAQKKTPEYSKQLSTVPTKSVKNATPSVKLLKTSTIGVNSLKGSTLAVKSATPVMKQGIKRFTPGSGRPARTPGSGRSARPSTEKTLPRKAPSPSKDSARRLFPEPQRKVCEPMPQLQHVPETPCNRNPAAGSTTATPSYPQTANNSKITLKTFVIKGKSYMFIKKLGSGGSSEVFKVLEVGGECGEYAVKCVNLAVERNLAQGYINEIRLLRDLQSSDRVIQLYAYEYDKANQSLKVVMEVGETDLSSFLKACQSTRLPPALVLYYWMEMLHAVNHIHQHGVVHADLKPANFLLVSGRLKLIDFGIASAISTDATSVERPCAAGTFSYISPEAVMGGAGRYESTHAALQKEDNAPIKISFKSDVWSLGCILYSMVYGTTPFGHITHFYGKIGAIVDPKHVISYPAAESMPPNLMSAMQWCLTYNAKLRPSVQELLSIDYLSTSRQHLPQELLAKLQPHATPDELALLHKATIQSSVHQLYGFNYKDRT